jgi:hypothetical protein
MFKVAFFACAAVLAFAGTADAGFDNPLKWDGVHVIHRCPHLTNPIECSNSGHSNSNSYGHPLSRLHRPHLDHRQRCTILRDRYLFHHWQGKPDSLRGYTGCALYRKDAAYHSALYGLGIHAPSSQEGFEAFVSEIRHLILTGQTGLQ